MLRHPDLIHALRRLARAPGFTFVAVATLAVGIGASTAIFALLDSVLFRPLPYPDAKALVAVWQTAPGLNIAKLNAAPSTYFTYRDEARTFTDIGMWNSGSATVTGVGEPEQVPAVWVTDGVLPLLGIPPLHGRWHSRADDQANAPLTAVLTHGYWVRRFGADPGAVGRTITINGAPAKVLGVMPPHFRFLDERASVILPQQLDRSRTFIGNFSFRALARLKPGVTVAQANSDVVRMIALLPAKFPPAPGMSLQMLANTKMGADVHPLAEDVVGNAGATLWVLMGGVGLLLLIACANVTNLMLVRGQARRQEMAVRSALGGGWPQLLRGFLAESLLVGLAGAVSGIAIAWVALRVLIAAAPPGLPRRGDISLDTWSIVFAAGAALSASLLFALVPALRHAVFARGGTGALRESTRNASVSRERHRARNVLVVTQVALALVLLVGAGLMIRTARALAAVQPGFTNPEQIFTARISIPEALTRDPEAVLAMNRQIVERVSAIPGVTSAAMANSLIMDGRNSADPIFVEDRPAAESTIPPIRRYKFTTPGLFATLGQPILAGRDLSWADVQTGLPVVLMSANLAREFWGSPQAALGKRVRENPRGVWREVIGVVADEYDDGVSAPPPKVVYWPLLVRQMWGQPVQIRRATSLAIRSSRVGTPGFAAEVERAVWAVNGNLPVAGIGSMRQIQAESMARTSMLLVILSLVAAMALLLGLVGIYGVVSYAVSERTREIGIRMALGAAPLQVRRMFVRDALLLAGAGTVCGLAGAAAATRAMSSALYGVSRLDPLTYVVVPLALIAAAALASYVPARRASQVAPVEALRAGV